MVGDVFINNKLRRRRLAEYRLYILKLIENTAWAVKRRHVFLIHEEEDNNAGIQSVLVYQLHFSFRIHTNK
jgi:hypothetical protein